MQHAAAGSSAGSADTQGERPGGAFQACPALKTCEASFTSRKLANVGPLGGLIEATPRVPDAVSA